MSLSLVRRPYEYDPDIGRLICRRLANGAALKEVCQDIDMPEECTVFDWINAVEDFALRYARARQTQADVLADEIVSLSNAARIGVIVTDGVNDKGPYHKEVQQDMVERTKLQIDARKWFASKVAPSKYGDRVAHQMLDEHGKTARTGGVVIIIDGAAGKAIE